ncbi:SufE family protein [Candidatus Peregrinibacteria bacterium]|jgi:cysteine desulfuration protein SufE|nr:SufE family protein [Candidatus Peregrinibacteria bacterium]
MTKTINQIQDEIIKEFELFDNWEDRYEHLINLGQELPPLPKKLKTEDTLVPGCQSKVWLHISSQNATLHLQGQSDALITSGLLALILRIFNNQPPKEIQNAELYFIDRIKLAEHLSQTRANGLYSIIQRIKDYTIKC